MAHEPPRIARISRVMGARGTCPRACSRNARGRRLQNTFEQNYRRLIEQIQPVLAPISGLAFRRQRWPVPVDLSKSRGPQCVLMCFDTEEIVFNVKLTVVQIEGPCDWSAFAELTHYSCPKTIFSV